MTQKTELQVAGRRVSLFKAGAAGGDPVVLLHGGRAGVSPIATGAHVFDRVISLFAAGRAVIAPDLPGYAGTDLASPADLDVEKQASFVLALLDTLSVDRAHLVGHDLGGFVATLARDRRTEARALIIDRSKSDVSADRRRPQRHLV